MENLKLLSLDSFENFKTDEIASIESTIGGELENTTFSGADGATGRDFYDTVNNRVVYRQE